MGEYCDRCGKKDIEVKRIISIRSVDIYTDEIDTDTHYLKVDPHLCKVCWKVFLKNIEKVIYDSFGYI